jgi:hypothetical protein
MFPRYFKAATNKLVRIAEKLQVEWMLIGAAAVSKWGFPRATQDVDFTLALDETKSTAVDDLMKKSGFEKLSGPEEIPASGLKLSKYWLAGPSKQPEDGIGVDIFFTSTEWQHEAMGRKVAATVAKGWPDFWIASKEDLLLYKLAALRAKDVIDLEGLMERQYASFDWRYISFWAGELGILTHVEDLISQYQVSKGLEEKLPWESE